MLTPEQAQAIAFDDGRLQLIACAGSGKTETVTRRVARLVADGVPADSIVAFTFTDRAAAEMAARVRDHLREIAPGRAGPAGLFVGTIHAYCRQRLADALPQYRTFDLLDDDARPLFCRRHYADLGLERLLTYYVTRSREPSRYEVIRDFCRNADLVRDERIDPARLASPFCECYRAYIDLLRALHYLDFAGMIANYVEALEADPALLARERERVRHLIVDEYQDVNTLQERLIALTAGETGNLCVVGDDDQCIYQWRGANYEQIISFGTRYPDVTTVRIQQNFRSTPGLVEAAARVIDRNEYRLPKAMRPWSEGRRRTGTDDIAACFFANEADEVAGIVEQIGALRGRPYVNSSGDERHLAYRDMAVLMRSVRTRARPLLDAFDRAGVPYVVRGGRLFNRPEVAIVMHALAFLGGYPYPLRAAVPVDLRRLAEVYGSLDLPRADPVAFGGAMTTLRRETGGTTRLSLQEAFHQVLRALGADRIPFPETWYYNLGALSQLVTAFEHLYPRITPEEVHLFLEYVQGYALWTAEEGGPEAQGMPDAVTVATLHQAKGLQYPAVFIPRLNAGEFPSGRPETAVWFVPPYLFDRGRYATALEDERRLFYVGITRSEQYLFLSGHRQCGEDRTVAEPSIFFDEYPRDHVVDRFPASGASREAGSDAFPGPPRSAPLVETSWSALRYYARCPHDYRLRHVYGFDPMPKEEMGLGRAVHAVLAAVHERAAAGGLGIEEIPGMVDEHLLLRFAPPATVDRVRESVARQTLRYVLRSREDLGRIAEVELPFTVPFEEGIVSGAMDLVLTEVGGGVELRDFKLTEEGESGFRHDAEQQLRLYALAAGSLGHEVRRASICHFDTGSIAEVAVGPQALEETRAAINGMMAGIRRQEFPMAPEEARCTHCDWGCVCCGSASNRVLPVP